MSNVDKGSLESRKEFEDSPSDQYRYWDRELKASDKNLRSFRKQGTKIVSRYVAKESGRREEGSGRQGQFRLNLFHSNITTLQSMWTCQRSP